MNDFLEVCKKIIKLIKDLKDFLRHQHLSYIIIIYNIYHFNINFFIVSIKILYWLYGNNEELLIELINRLFINQTVEF